MCDSLPLPPDCIDMGPARQGILGSDETDNSWDSINHCSLFVRQKVDGQQWKSIVSKETRSLEDVESWKTPVKWYSAFYRLTIEGKQAIRIYYDETWCWKAAVGYSWVDFPDSFVRLHLPICMDTTATYHTTSCSLFRLSQLSSLLIRLHNI